METIEIRKGSIAPQYFRPKTADGPVVVTDEKMQMRVYHDGQCVPIDATVVDGMFAISPQQLDFPDRVYRASVYLDQGGGLDFYADYALNIQGGC